MPQTSGEELTISVYPNWRVFRKASMSNDRMARPVSGEIMTDSQRDGSAGSHAIMRHDVVDADFETILPGAANAALSEKQASQRPAGQAGMDMLRNHETGELRRHQSGGPVFWVVGLALIFGAFWVSGGHAIVSNRPPSESALAPVTLQPLRIINVVSRIDRKAERVFLLVDGEVANESKSGAALPPLAILVTAKDGRVTHYFLGTNDKVLRPGERFAFSSRLHAPNEGVATVTVDFRKEGDG